MAQHIECNNKSEYQSADMTDYCQMRLPHMRYIISCSLFEDNVNLD